MEDIFGIPFEWFVLLALNLFLTIILLLMNLGNRSKIKKLKARQFIELGSEPDEEGRPITYFRITKAGEDWIIANEDRLSLKITESENYNENDDLPF